MELFSLQWGAEFSLPKVIRDIVADQVSEHESLQINSRTVPPAYLFAQLS